MPQITWSFNRTTKMADITVDGVVVESTQLTQAFRRVETLKAQAEGKAAPKFESSRAAYRREQKERGANNGYGYTRSGRR